MNKWAQITEIWSGSGLVFLSAAAGEAGNHALGGARPPAGSLWSSAVYLPAAMPENLPVLPSDSVFVVLVSSELTSTHHLIQSHFGCQPLGVLGFWRVMHNCITISIIHIIFIFALENNIQTDNKKNYKSSFSLIIRSKINQSADSGSE